jgi:uncharacterized membrane protein YeaQ/YmgE (transglycosylase-associated protein family)
MAKKMPFYRPQKMGLRRVAWYGRCMGGNLFVSLMPARPSPPPNSLCSKEARQRLRALLCPPRRAIRRGGARGERESDMTMEAILILIVVGAVAGWLAGLLVRGFGMGLVGNIVVGIVGAFIASWLLPRIGVAFSVGNPMVTAILYATIGAVILLLIVGLVRRGT